MTRRAISTVLDVALCLLLVTAAVGTIAAVPAGDATDSPDARAAATETARLLGSVTATVEYRAASRGSGRRTHGTLASLLVEAALADVDVRGTDLPGGERFGAAVAAAIRPHLAGVGWRGQVVATWRPYPGAHVGATVTVGPSPPPTADVSVAVLTVPTGLPAAHDRAVNVADRGFDAVATIVAEAVVAGLFPTGSTRRALRGPPTVADPAVRRFRRVAAAYGRPLAVSPASDPARLNDRLVAAVAPAVETDLRATFGTPAAAAHNVSVGVARIVVRTWSS